MRGRLHDAVPVVTRAFFVAPLQVVTGARTTKLATEKGSAGVRAVGVEYAVGGPSGSRQTGVCLRAVTLSLVLLCYYSCMLFWACMQRSMQWEGPAVSI
jgi:hypothetical protein